MAVNVIQEHSISGKRLKRDVTTLQLPLTNKPGEGRDGVKRHGHEVFIFYPPLFLLNQPIWASDDMIKYFDPRIKIFNSAMSL